jgi:hypothetical protein
VRSRTTKPVAPPTKRGPTSRDPLTLLKQALRTQGWLTNQSAREATGLDAKSVRPLLQHLVIQGHARVEGRKRGTRYLAG